MHAGYSKRYRKAVAEGSRRQRIKNFSEEEIFILAEGKSKKNK